MPCSNTGQFCYKELVSMPKRKKTESKKSTSNLTPKQKEYDKQYKALVNKLKRKAKDINKRGYTIPEDLIPEMPKKRFQKYLQELKERVENIYDYVYYVKQETGEYFTGLQRRGQERREAAQKAAQVRKRNANIRAIEQFERDYRKFYEENREAIENGEYLRTPEQNRNLRERPEEVFKPPRKPTQEEYYTLPHEAEIILDRIYSEIERWQPDPRWSSQLENIKRDDTNQLRSVIDGAINQLGREQVIRNLAANAEEFEALCMEIMYVSGSARVELGREGVRIDLVKITQFVWGRSLTVEESQILEHQAEMYNEYE